MSANSSMSAFNSLCCLAVSPASLRFSSSPIGRRFLSVAVSASERGNLVACRSGPPSTRQVLSLSPSATAKTQTPKDSLQHELCTKRQKDTKQNSLYPNGEHTKHITPRCMLGNPAQPHSLCQHRHNIYIYLYVRFFLFFCHFCQTTFLSGMEYKYKKLIFKAAAKAQGDMRREQG